MPLTGIQPGDIVKVDKRGRLFLAVVTSKESRKLKLTPLTPNINYHEASSNEVKEHFKKMGRKRQSNPKEAQTV